MKTIFIVLFIFVFASCSSTSKIYETAYPTLNDGKYDSEFPYKSSSKQLEEISHSIKMINVLVFYTSYFFDESSKITVSDLSQKNVINKAYKKTNYHQPASGTATIISSTIDQVVLLTCAHIIDFPDTIITYFLNESGNNTLFIESISIKADQSNFIPDFPEGGKVEIISIDKKTIWLLLEKIIRQTKTIIFLRLNIPKEKPRSLSGVRLFMRSDIRLDKK